ncbi:hypothetical protein AKJ37_01715 [candidate division MSBL1 archaeon SCGC-AAA259I09]|uniref:Uncharacterized protein n=1 Tax=candidate division MSBL1 archaeon SCGC-AAA259I09 TaxID=1698267 RepID=A0A133UUW5_9EURY|nr:hypothetical protein AKJ37_01715 [candidate division MSBL1 archaeon SCGC-AAA259I09]
MAGNDVPTGKGKVVRVKRGLPLAPRLTCPARLDTPTERVRWSLATLEPPPSLPSPEHGPSGSPTISPVRREGKRGADLAARGRAPSSAMSAMSATLQAT